MKRNITYLFALSMIFLQLQSQPSDYLLHENWKAIRATDVLADGTAITSSDFELQGWMDAVVPGTILTTLLHNQLIPDPFFGMNNTAIPDVYNTGRDYYTYWFYTEFEIPAWKEGQEVWLNFRGINYFADVFLNGKRVNTNTHAGMYLREKYLITPYLSPGKKNKLAVWVAPPDPAGNPNGGQGGDGTIGRNVTMQCTAGWDWICSIPDRNTGIWDQVSLDITGSIDIRNPYIECRVPGKRFPGAKQDPVYLRSSVELVNTSGQTIEGTMNLSGKGFKGSAKVVLGPYERKEVGLKELKIENPELWWPNGIGNHPLYDVKIEFSDKSGRISDSESLTIGIRETGQYFDDHIKARVFTVNGQKVFIKGGNWIASDALMRLTKDRYDAEVRFHADMNMNMIRIWGGGLTERPEFYEACDKYGLLVWQDLWISGDCNGEWNDPAKKESQARRKAYPDNHALFLESVVDQVKMLRNHPSLYLWCGSNETKPPDDILKSIENEILPQLDPKRFFLDYSTSARLMTNTIGGVGDGPYGIREPETIFLERSFPFNPETGSIGIPNYEGLQKIIPADELIPPSPSSRVSKSWQYHKYLPLHDFPDRYGEVKDIRDFCLKAQIVSYEQYRALQEAFNHKMWDWYSGMLVWKNQNPWTALRGFFYDYYLDYAGGFFGYKHGAAPVHIQLNLNDSVVCIVNQTTLDLANMTAIIRLYDLHGKLVNELTRTVDLKSQVALLLDKITLPAGDDEVYFLKLELRDGDIVRDENLYWLTNKSGSYRKLNDLAIVTLDTKIEKGQDNHASIRISNKENEPAFFIRLKVINSENELLLPSFFSENYFTLMPGEEKKIELEFPSSHKSADGEQLTLGLEGWNIQSGAIKF